MVEAPAKKVVVFIPAYNEEGSIASVIHRMREVYPPEATLPKGYYIQLLVVNDGSMDRTEEIATALDVTVVSHPVNQGLGAATRTALESAVTLDADVAVKLDADFQHDPEDVEKVILPLIQNRADICWGSRFAGQINYRMPLVRYVGNHFFTWVMNRMTLYTITDAQTGLFALSRKYLQVFELYGDYNPPQQILLDANLKRMRFIETPVVFHPRTTGESFISFRYPFYVFANIMRVLIYANPLKVFTKLGGLFILLSLGYFTLSRISLSHGWDTPLLRLEHFSVVTLLMGLQMIFYGLLADLILKKRK